MEVQPLNQLYLVQLQNKMISYNIMVWKDISLVEQAEEDLEDMSQKQNSRKLKILVLFTCLFKIEVY